MHLQFNSLRHFPLINLHSPHPSLSHLIQHPSISILTFTIRSSQSQNIPLSSSSSFQSRRHHHHCNFNPFNLSSSSQIPRLQSSTLTLNNLTQNQQTLNHKNT
ncbi:hypothetical protein RYX36_019745 [Vicia faba]